MSYVVEEWALTQQLSETHGVKTWQGKIFSPPFHHDLKKYIVWEKLKSGKRSMHAALMCTLEPCLIVVTLLYTIWTGCGMMAPDRAGYISPHPTVSNVKSIFSTNPIKTKAPLLLVLGTYTAKDSLRAILISTISTWQH